MSVRVAKEPEDLEGCLEDCEKCGKPTKFWWHSGCMPLCPKCARKMNAAEALARAKAGGYGPLPEEKEQTDA